MARFGVVRITRVERAARRRAEPGAAKVPRSNERLSSNEEYNSVVVPTTHTTKPIRPKADPHLQAAGERVKAAAEELERLGIADANGKRVHTDLPTDMRDGVDRDFGG